MGMCVYGGQSVYVCVNLPQTVAAAITRFLFSTLYCISWVGGKKAEPDAESSYTLI